MMQQYLNIKEKYSDCILFFRLGDFYEMFFDDAKLASRELELTLTGKQCGLEERAPMCGVPFHAADTYIGRLVEKGYKVAICEQTEDPASAKGLVDRDVIQIVTPGTLISAAMLKENENNYIASAFADGSAIGFAYCDVSTGEIHLTSISGPRQREDLINELVKISAREVIVDENTKEGLDVDEIQIITDAYFNVAEDHLYRPEAVRDAIRRQFAVSGLHGLGIEEGSAAEMALGSLLLYLYDAQRNDLKHIRNLQTYQMGQHMSLDKSTVKNLELTETLFEKKLQGSLLGVLDKTHTAMGSRKMKQWLKEPLNNVAAINQRLDCVELLLEDMIARNNIKEHLKRVYDFERLAGRIATGRANGRDIIALKNSCYVLPEIKNELQDLCLNAGETAEGESQAALLTQLRDAIDPLDDLYDLIDRSIIEDPPFTVTEGGLIKKGYSERLDEIKDSIQDAQEWIASLEGKERERTGIKNLKVGFNKVFGYYLEVTKSYYDLIPEDYIRKQTLVNCERFITPQLKETERVVLNAENEINKIEYELFDEIRQKLQLDIDRIQKTSDAIATLDVLTAFAHVAEKNDYVKPLVDDEDIIMIEKGRHPVIEQTIHDGIFVSNDTFMDRENNCMLLITGPNMSGKSTYMRQTALIVLMAQAGCFVPCDKARIGVCDRIFTRIGAYDNLAQGQSTFFVEMSELSYILNTATERSLVILDEIGRGTSTYDGLSIAWATVEYFARPDRRIRTLFATHYHEMTTLEGKLPGVHNLNVDVAEENGNVVFLHKIVEGSASQSYGIHVAKLSGAPEELLENAQIHLDAFQDDKEHNLQTFEQENAQIHQSEQPAKPLQEEMQLSFFDAVPDPVLTRLRNVDLMNTTPSQALQLLEELKEKL